MKRLWKAFAAGVMEGCRPFFAVVPGLLKSMAVSCVIVLAGGGAIDLAKAMAEPVASAISFLGEGLLIGGAAYALVSSVRAWVVLIRAAGFIGEDRQR